MFFSVKVPMKIGAKNFRTCICYALPDYLKSTVEKLVAEGKAEMYEENRFFCNGKLVEKKKAKATPKKTSNKKEVVKENLTTEENTEDGVNGF